MTDNAKTVAIGYGKGLTDDVYEGTGSLWEYRYAGVESQYSGSIDPIFGPGCRIHPNTTACYAGPTGHSGPEGTRKYDYVTLKPGQDTYVYLDVGFWGKTDRRTFGLICGPHVWLCDYSQRGDAPEPENRFATELYQFHHDMGKFKVVTHATVPMDQSGDTSQKLLLILPDMHMWPDPEELKKRHREFFDEDELKQLNSGLQDGTIVKDSSDALDVPNLKGESADEHALRMMSTPHGRVAMKKNALSDTRKMREEEAQHSFGSTAGNDLVRLLQAVERARQNPESPFDVTLLHVGDLLEMWAPYHTWVGSKPFDYEADALRLTDTANQRVPKWIDMVYNYGHNKAALQELEKAACRQIYGNHDFYLAFGFWKPTGIPVMDRLKDSPGFFSEGLVWVEHGQRFDASNRDGYWTWLDLDHPPGPEVNTSVNYYPDLRNLGDRYDNSDSNLYTKNVPYATIWYLLAHYAKVDPSIGFRLPPKFRIFCQGHTHSPVLLKVQVFWSKLEGKYTGTSREEDVMKEEQLREQRARQGGYNPPTGEDMAQQLEREREAGLPKYK